jgi:allantoicase
MPVWKRFSGKDDRFFATDLASERLGGGVIAANDEFFAPKENLLKESKPVFIEGKYTALGKWMDGWETRRRRTPGYDWCVLRLGLPGIIRGIVVDTSFFTGNYPEQFSLEGCDLGPHSPGVEKKELFSAKTEWAQIVRKALQGDSRNQFLVATVPVYASAIGFIPMAASLACAFTGKVQIQAEWRRAKSIWPRLKMAGTLLHPVISFTERRAIC